MKPKNNGQKEDNILQKKFTTYVELAVKRRRKDYFVLQYRDMEISSSLEEFDVAYAFDFDCERLEGIPGWMVIENKALQEELQKLSDRNLCIFWNHVVEKESLANIARDLEMPYDTVTAIYYRTLKSIKEAMPVFKHTLKTSESAKCVSRRFLCLLRLRPNPRRTPNVFWNAG